MDITETLLDEDFLEDEEDWTPLAEVFAEIFAHNNPASFAAAF